MEKQEIGGGALGMLQVGLTSREKADEKVDMQVCVRRLFVSWRGDSLERREQSQMSSKWEIASIKWLSESQFSFLSSYFGKFWKQHDVPAVTLGGVLLVTSSL